MIHRAAAFALPLLLAIAPAQAKDQTRRQRMDAFWSEYSSIHDRCIDRSGGVTVEILNCAADEQARQEKRLNANYQALLKRLSPTRQAELRKAQRLWLQLRDANCDSWVEPMGGSSQGLFHSSCYLEMTTRRATELEIMQPPE